MFAIAPVAINSTALSVPPSVLAAPAQDLVSTRLTSVALPAPLADTQLDNNAPARVQIVSPAIAEETPPTIAAASTGSTAPFTTNGPSSAFLAQLISQSVDDQQDNQIALATTFSRFAPALQYNALLGYSVVKYRPSDAGLPSAYTPAAAVSRQVSGGLAATAAATNEYRAYSATQSRNQSELAGSEGQLAVA
jgi:hypothetical protein